MACKFGSPTKAIMKLSLWFVVLFFIVSFSAAEEYQFVCENNGFGLSIVDVLQATREHNAFLNLFSHYDPEGFAILSDAELSDKTVWAPTDAAFLEIGDALSSLSDEEIKAILGYHITPPRRTPDGSYPIITPQFLEEGFEVIHQTRTGILTGSDQRLRSKVDDGLYTIEDASIMPLAWCSQSGSVFSINKVIMDVRTASLTERMFNQVLYILFFHKYSYLVLSGVAVGMVGSIVYVINRYRSKAA